MGGTPLIELYIVFNELASFLDGRGIGVGRNLIGPYITSLEMQGCSITLLKLDDELTDLWDAPVKTPGLRWGV
jgi:dihydroxyacetone kinase-like protein